MKSNQIHTKTLCQPLSKIQVSLYNYKQLLDEVFVISRIIKVEVGVINRSRRPNLIIVLLYIERNKKTHVCASSPTESKTKRANFSLKCRLLLLDKTTENDSCISVRICKHVLNLQLKSSVPKTVLSKQTYSF